MNARNNSHSFDTGALKQKVSDRKEALHEKADESAVVRGRAIRKGDIFKAVGLVAFFAIMIIACVLLWPFFHQLFEPGGRDLMIEDVRNAGPLGFLILLGLQFLQVVVALIPGEVVQVAAGMMYGPALGTVLILVGCLISSAFIFALVHRLGAPFVKDVVPTNFLQKFEQFEESGKLSIVVFVLFLIPGMPKDVFTYLVPLTSMRMRTFLALTTIGRIPGVILSTYAASGLVDGRLTQSLVIFAVAAVVVAVAIVKRDRIMAALEKHSRRRK